MEHIEPRMETEKSINLGLKNLPRTPYCTIMYTPVWSSIDPMQLNNISLFHMSKVTNNYAAVCKRMQAISGDNSGLITHHHSLYCPTKSIYE